MTADFPKSSIRLPRLPALVAGHGQAVWLTEDGEPLALRPGDAAERLRAADGAVLLCHAPATLARLGEPLRPVFDLLELFAFTRPATFSVPTPAGLAEALDQPHPENLEQAAALLPKMMAQLLEELAETPNGRAAAMARAMGRGGWAWAECVAAACDDVKEWDERSALAIWNRLPEWAGEAPEPQPGNIPVDPDAARRRLAELVGSGAEARPTQADYASAVCHAFAPREQAGAPNMVLAEAGTGTGKTLGYVAPASLWAEENEGPVWISTYTRNLQHQIDGELDRLYPDPRVKARRVVVRKGRENYLCLLNLEEAVRAVPMRPETAVGIGLMARWALASRDGDLVGGDFPSWLAHLVGRGRTLGLADRRGECIYSACSHYQRCFIERSIRHAKRASIVIANHALVLIQAAVGDERDPYRPSRYVFDEGHHLFDAADGAFSAHLTMIEMRELRRWLLGAENARSGRARGLRRRIDDLVSDDEEALAALDAVLQAARILPDEGWMGRLIEGDPRGPAEAFARAVRIQVYARNANTDSPYGLETETNPIAEPVAEAAAALADALARMERPLKTLRTYLAGLLDDEADTLETGQRQRIEAVQRSLLRRALLPIGAWRAMLEALPGDAEPPSAEGFVDWFAVERFDGQDRDIGLHRHWIDPTIPFAREVAADAQGLVVTSATLRDGTGDPEADWAVAESRTGACWLPQPALRATHASPFDYAAQTRVLVVTDVRKDDLKQVAAAYRTLIEAAGGGALGLFTAISRLRAVHREIAPHLETAGLPLYAQHVDRMDTSTLIEIFRSEEDAVLLGTDAVRDGVDVPGRSLRLIVFDRVPWPRPNILHRARRAAFGSRGYDDMITRLRLKQAFGRLIRKADDRGVFVLLDPMMPSRLAGAFPEGVGPDEGGLHRVGLAEAAAEVARMVRDRTRSAARTG